LDDVMEWKPVGSNGASGAVAEGPCGNNGANGVAAKGAATKPKRTKREAFLPTSVSSRMKTAPVKLEDFGL
jgi:hypothetical protein